MSTSCFNRIADYPITAVTPTDDLLTLGRYYSEIGGYASTVATGAAFAFAKRCASRLRLVTNELVKRRIIKSVDDLFVQSACSAVLKPLDTLSIDELEQIFRQSAVRQECRRSQGREPLTFYVESKIVRELERRYPTNSSESLKIDYCSAVYQNELDNLSFLLSMPVLADPDKIYPDSSRNYTFDDLAALIALYRGCRDVTEREILIEYIDIALDLLESNADDRTSLGLIAEIAGVGAAKIIKIPGRINNKLEECVRRSLSESNEDRAELVVPMLTLHMINGDLSLERKSRQIINRCYKSVCDNIGEPAKLIFDLNIAVTCCDYVTRFSVRKMSACWNTLSHQLLVSDCSLTARQIFQLLDTAKELDEFTQLSESSKARLKSMLYEKALLDSPESKAYNKMV